MKTQTITKIAAMAILGGVTLAGCKGKQQDQQGGQAPEFAVMTVSAADASLTTDYPATLHGKNDVEIRPQISGFLTKVHVKEGQHVSAGQVLFTIDQVQLQASVDAAKAAVAVAQANVNTAKTNMANNKILLDKNIIAPTAYQTSVDAYNAAMAQLNQSKANLVSSQKNLSYTVVTAPAPGIVGTIDNKEGSLVSPSTLLTVLSDNGGMEAYFSMTEKEVLALTDGGTRTVNAAVNTMPEVELQLADGTMYPQKGKIISISGVLDQATGSALVKAAFPNPEGMLRSGNTGIVKIPNMQRDVIQIPQTATFEIQDMKFVYVLGDSAKVHQRPIEIDENNDGKNYIVTSGLTPGDVIVVEGVGVGVKDGMTITPKGAVEGKAAPQQATQSK